MSPKAMRRTLKALNAIQTLADMTQQAVQSAESIGRAISLFKQAQLAMEMGTLQAFIADIDAYVQQLDATMTNLGNSITEGMSEMAQLAQLFNGIVQSLSQSVSSLERIS